MFKPVEEVKITSPIYLEANFTPDERFLEQAISDLVNASVPSLTIEGPALDNCNKTVGGQLSIDIERLLNYDLSDTEVNAHPAIHQLSNGRKVFADGSLVIKTSHSAGQSYAAFLNSGITFIHDGTCNDGVGKGASGGRIVVTSPGGGATDVAGNVLIGNFALFGATGGELFVEGQAGDRFGVRNSGAVAVVEGVGDFCCEYMTNGSIVNLGAFGKGFGNGMSGGSAYQYDQTGAILTKCSKDSVKAICLAEASELTAGHEVALRYHLEQHLLATKSTKTQLLLDDWENSRAHFYVLIPLSLFSYQCSEQIFAHSARKNMLEELSQYYAKQLTLSIKSAYHQIDQQQYLFNGKLPDYGELDSTLICQYINATGTIRRAFEAAQKSDAVKKGNPLIE
ncbi:hypothetical protein [Psychromonas sp. KJ10-2]|uniref:GltB/FmdC/FwdC-like GXGXG domain-containing protein n=1 Tax=Psychromonas sp. KJ10-2 TaxID=3391822 RepID=UPI0039B5FD79